MVMTLLNIRTTRADKNFFYRERHKKGIKTLSKVFCNAYILWSQENLQNLVVKYFKFFAWLEICNEANISKAFLIKIKLHIVQI